MKISDFLKPEQKFIHILAFLLFFIYKKLSYRKNWLNAEACKSLDSLKVLLQIKDITLQYEKDASDPSDPTLHDIILSSNLRTLHTY